MTDAYAPTSREEALRALADWCNDRQVHWAAQEGDYAQGRVNAFCEAEYEIRQQIAILATASEQAPVGPDVHREAASIDAVVHGTGFLVDGKHVAPCRVEMIQGRFSSPAHTSEARNAAFVETLAREYSLLRGWSLDDWNNPSMKNRADIIADMRMAYDAAMRQEAE